MQVRLLGPVDVLTPTGVRPVPGLRRKALLVALALHAGQPVPADRLIEIVWDGRPPPTAANSLQRHVSYLRGQLGGRAAIVVRPLGYLLDLPVEGTDLAAAERLIAGGRRARDPATTADLLRAALARWRGRPLADVGGLSWLDDQAARLSRLELSVRLSLIDARLALAEHDDLVPELESLVEEHPYQERIHGRLMLALYRGGRQSDALDAYRRLRAVLADELGVDPSRESRDLEGAILRQDAALDLPRPPIQAGAGPDSLPAVELPAVELPAVELPAVELPAAEAPVAGPVVPAELPVAVRGFVGRRAELARLDGWLLADRSGPLVVALTGTAGVGKTTFAVHWAHRVAGEFPDGQLYVNLRGFDADGAAVRPETAIRGFLDAFGVPAWRIPADLSGQAAMYRSTVAGWRVLVVLDNARDAGQVRPLLPGSAGCLTLVTSRDELLPLVVSEDARPLTLDLPSPAEARDLLTARIGAERLAAEPATVHDLISRCARLPLALAVVAARAAARPSFPLAALVDELEQSSDALDPFESGDPGTDVRAVFSWSYRTLTVSAARLFRLLGLHPGPDLSRAAVASLAGLPVRQVRPLLAELTRTHLLTEHTPGRYGFHDLLRGYARELVARYEHAGDRDRSRYRLFEHYLHSADAAARWLDPHRESIVSAPPLPGVQPEAPADHAAAVAWYRAEQPVLLAAVEAAARTGADRHCWRLAWAMFDFLDIHGYWHDLAAVQKVAMAAARRLADPSGQAHAHWGLARAEAKLGRNATAYSHFRQALALFEEIGDRTSQAHTQLNLGWSLDRQDRYADALGHVRKAMTLYEEIGDRPGQADALNAIGWYLTHLGDARQALTYCRRAVALHEETADEYGESQAWDSLGWVHADLGEHRAAIECYLRSLELVRRLGVRFGQTSVLTHLGDARQAAGDPDGARDAWLEALVILDQLGHPDADGVRARLRTPALA